MTEQFIYSSYNDLDTILAGAREAKEVITRTMGPDGKLVSIIDEPMRIRETKDGATVAKSLIGTGKNELHKYGVKFLTDASILMANKVGDGSTTVVLLTYEIMAAVLNWRKVGISSDVIIKALNYMNKMVHDAVEKISIKIDSNSDYIKKIATISSGDEEVGENMKSLFNKLGDEAMIIVDESKQEHDVIKFEEGYFFDRGYESPAFLKPNTDEHTKGKIELNDPYILLFDKPLQSIAPLLELFQNISKQGKPLVIIAESFDNDVIRNLVFNRVLNNILNCVCVKLPGYGDSIRDSLLDIAVVTGAKPQLYEHNQPIEHSTINNLGRAKKIIITNESTTILNGHGSEENIRRRMNELQNHAVNANSFTQEKIQERISKLASKIGKFSVGGKDEHAVKEKKDRVEDAKNACTNSLKNGIVPGAGSEFLYVYTQIKNIHGKTQSEEIGLSILKAVLPKITQTIITNGKNFDPHIITHQIIENMTTNDNPYIGYINNANCQIGNIMEAGVVNPSLVAIKGMDIACETGKRFAKIDIIMVNKTEQNNNLMNKNMY